MFLYKGLSEESRTLNQREKDVTQNVSNLQN